jgi:hypothetical protein
MIVLGGVVGVEERGKDCCEESGMYGGVGGIGGENGRELGKVWRRRGFFEGERSTGKSERGTGSV